MKKDLLLVVFGIVVYVVVGVTGALGAHALQTVSLPAAVAVSVSSVIVILGVWVFVLLRVVPKLVDRFFPSTGVQPRK